MKKRPLFLLTALAMAASIGLPATPAWSAGMGTTNEFWWPDKLNLESVTRPTPRPQIPMVTTSITPRRLAVLIWPR